MIDQVQVFRPAPSGYERAAERYAEAEDMLSTPLMPGLKLPLADLFA